MHVHWVKGYLQTDTSCKKYMYYTILHAEGGVAATPSTPGTSGKTESTGGSIGAQGK